MDRPAQGDARLAGVLMGVAGLMACLALWWFVTRGVPEERIISPSKGLSSPAETFASFHSLWFDRALTRNLLTTLRRLALGLRSGRAGRRASGCPLRLFSAGAGLLPADDSCSAAISPWPRSFP